MSNILKNALASIADAIKKDSGIGFRKVEAGNLAPAQHKSFIIELTGFDNESDYRETEDTVIVLRWEGNIKLFYDQAVTSIDKYHEINNDIIKIKSALLGTFSTYISQFSWIGSAQIEDYQEDGILIVVMNFEIILRETET